MAPPSDARLGFVRPEVHRAPGDVRLVLSGLGLTMGMEEAVRPYIERGQVVPVLEPYCPPFGGFYLYHPQRRQASPALRALIAYLLELRQKGP
ncbi:MAG TPA: LysR substrate-binding domain-containing protein [Longimicrobium sp.]